MSNDLCNDSPRDTAPMFGKGGQERVRNRYPAQCSHCGRELPPGVGVVGSRDESGRYNWLCPWKQ